MLFMNFNLDKLVKNLSDKNLKYLIEEFRNEKLKLVKEKGIYPYEYMSSFKKFKENECKFFCSLKDCGINEKEYQRAINVWKAFEIKSLGEYYDLYLETDVLLLCDVFEKLIKTCLEYYCLDPSPCFSSPGLSWNAMLKMTGIKLKKLDNIDMHLFLEKGMRDGISYISKRYSSIKDNSTIMYWDGNNFYGWTMIHPLPDFKFLSEKEINRFDLDSISENSQIGYILECDLKYPEELHDLHNDDPSCPEKTEISLDMLSRYCNDIANKYGIKLVELKK